MQSELSVALANVSRHTPLVRRALHGLMLLHRGRNPLRSSRPSGSVPASIRFNGTNSVPRGIVVGPHVHTLRNGVTYNMSLRYSSISTHSSRTSTDSTGPNETSGRTGSSSGRTSRRLHWGEFLGRLLAGLLARATVLSSFAVRMAGAGLLYTGIISGDGSKYVKKISTEHNARVFSEQGPPKDPHERGAPPTPVPQQEVSAVETPLSPLNSPPRWLPEDVRNVIRSLRTVITVLGIMLDYGLTFSKEEKHLEAEELEKERKQFKLAEPTLDEQAAAMMQELMAASGELQAPPAVTEYVNTEDVDHIGRMVAESTMPSGSLPSVPERHPAANGGGDSNAPMPQAKLPKQGEVVFVDHTVLGRRRQRQVDLLHTRTARKLLFLAQQQGGLYVKAAQHIVSMSHALPPQFGRILSVLQDQAQPLPIEEVRKVFAQEFQGAAPEELFAFFDEKPIAAASLAQVHKAVTKDGRKVAVKVQYSYLREIFDMDLRTMHNLLLLTERLFPAFSLRWLGEQFDDHMRKETDFILEGQSGERIRALLRSRKDIYIPKVYWDLTAKRIITTEFIDGCKISDVERIKEMGLNPLKVFESFANAFGAMIFSFGFVHCDPHPGNALVRVLTPDNVTEDYDSRIDIDREEYAKRERSLYYRIARVAATSVDVLLWLPRRVWHTLIPPVKQAQVVLLDHGLYRQLDPEFRLTFATLFRALFIRDDQLVKECAEKLNIGEYWRVLPIILISRLPTPDPTLITDHLTPEQKRRLAAGGGLKQPSLADVVKFLSTLPADMIFVLKTLNLVRSLNRELGGSTANRVQILCNAAIEGAYVPPQEHDPHRENVVVPATRAPPPGVVYLDLRKRPELAPLAKLRLWFERVWLNLLFWVLEITSP